MERLRKFVLRAKVQIEDAGESCVPACMSGQHADPQPTALHVRGRRRRAPHAAPGAYLEADGIGVGGGEARAAATGSSAPGDKLAARGLCGDMPAADRIEHDWRLADIRAGLPQIYSPTRETFVAQMLNLDLLDGISFSKGCYTGQEIIARTQHLGRIKRRLYRLHLPEGEWSIGQALRLGDGRAGRLIEVARAGDGVEALAVLNFAAGTAGAEEDSASRRRGRCR